MMTQRLQLDGAPTAWIPPLLHVFQLFSLGADAAWIYALVILSRAAPLAAPLAHGALACVAVGLLTGLGYLAAPDLTYSVVGGTAARRWIGARLRWASLTVRTICASSVSLPTRVARRTSILAPFTVPPLSRSPGALRTGAASPVSIDSSTGLSPSSTSPSTGTRSPGRTRRRSPTWTCSNGTSTSSPS